MRKEIIMKTVKTYMVRKPSDISEVRDLTQKYAHQAKEVVIAETVLGIRPFANALWTITSFYPAKADITTTTNVRLSP